jgi:hypothetical protein
MRKITTILAVAASTAALLATAPTPSWAAEANFRDRHFDTAHPADLVWVHVEHGDRIVVVIHHRNLTFRSKSAAPHRVRVAYDTGRRFDGPEFYARVPYQADQDPELRPAQGWGTMHNKPLASCTGERASVSATRDITRFSIPRSCFGDPKRIRVHVRLWPWEAADGKIDVAPAVRTMGPWVSH